MKTIVSIFKDLNADESGAAFIEYTALLGVLLATAIGLLVAVGAWSGTMWTALCSALSTALASCTPPA